ncbi:MAG: hypothetical protein GX568_01945 [Candidatus Gastranaerophilales bacterium]|jgi:hypothetical protein|nr:hypothetical protein [Candidatus Gastranaerophilales bacterium]
MKEKEKIAYVDFKADPRKAEKKASLDTSFHTNPVIDRFFKLVHTKLTKDKDNYRSYTGFKPDDLL